MPPKKLSKIESVDLIAVLKARFEANMPRHKGVAWNDVESKLTPEKLACLNQMEETGGEPDVVILDKKSKTIAFADCSAETPKERRSICYDREALDKRKENKPRTDAMTMAKEMGVELLTEDEYRRMQEAGKYDLKTSSWIATPERVRKLGGALFCDRRYDTVFTYHNGADSYYAARGFRGKLTL